MNAIKNNQDIICEFCKEKISKTLPGWWMRTHCDKEECEEKHKEKIKLYNKNYVRKKPHKKLNNKSPKIIGKLNGRRCINCGKKLRDPFKFRCPTCFKRASNAFLDLEPVNQYKHRHNNLRE